MAKSESEHYQFLRDVMPEGGWVCFHCGEVFTTPGTAEDHFGRTPDARPGCLIKVQLGDERGLLMELRKVERELADSILENHKLDHEAQNYHDQVSELKRLFKDASTVYEAWLQLEHAENLAAASEEQLKALCKLVKDWQDAGGLGGSGQAYRLHQHIRKMREGLPGLFDEKNNR